MGFSLEWISICGEQPHWSITRDWYESKTKSAKLSLNIFFLNADFLNSESNILWFKFLASVFPELIVRKHWQNLDSDWSVMSQSHNIYLQILCWLSQNPRFMKNTYPCILWFSDLKYVCYRIWIWWLEVLFSQICFLEFNFFFDSFTALYTNSQTTYAFVWFNDLLNCDSFENYDHLKHYFSVCWKSGFGWLQLLLPYLFRNWSYEIFFTRAVVNLPSWETGN